MTALLATTALLAQAAAPAAGEPQQPNPILSLAPMVLFGLGFYFLLIRPQQKKAKEIAQKQAELKSGDKVATSAGIIGKVVTINDNEVTIEVASGVRIPFLRNAIVEFYADEPAAKA